MVGVVIIDQPLPKPLSSTGFDVVIVFLGRYTAHWLQTDVLAKTNNETYFILTNKLNTVKNEAVWNKLKSSEHRMVKCKVMLDLKRER